MLKIKHLFTSPFCVIFSTHSLQICRRWKFFSTFEDFHFDRLLSWSRCFIFSETFDLRFFLFWPYFNSSRYTQTPTHASTQASGSRIFFKKDQNQNYSLMMSLAIRINRLQEVAKLCPIYRFICTPLTSVKSLYILA